MYLGTYASQSRGFIMANPSLKNGYVSIANELVEKLASLSIPSSEMRIVWVVWRKTWGWKEGDRHKDWDWIALSQFEKMTQMKHANVSQSIKSLVCKHILIKEENRLKFNQNYDEWVVVKRIRVVCKHIPPSMQTHTKIGMQTHTYKRKKETNTKDISKTNVLQGEQWNVLIDLFKEVNPFYIDFYKNKTERKALDDLAGKIGYEKLRSTIEHLPEVTAMPYAPKITKPSELKRDLGKLIAFYKQHQSKLPKSNVYEV